MAKTSSKGRLGLWLSRSVKIAVVALLAPLAIGVLRGVLDQLDTTSLSGGTFRDWIAAGFMTYVWVHLLLARPVRLFQASHRLFSILAVWLFGGQVASVEDAGGKGKRGGGAGPEAGSPLVAFSPYVIPVTAILMCAAAWLLARWVDRAVLDGPMSFLIGLAASFHWLMTADALQQQRGRWHVETYLLAIGLVFVVSLLLGGAALMLAVPEFSLGRALADGLAQAQGIYATLVQRLFL